MFNKWDYGFITGFLASELFGRNDQAVDDAVEGCGALIIMYMGISMFLGFFGYLVGMKNIVVNIVLMLVYAIVYMRGRPRKGLILMSLTFLPLTYVLIWLILGKYQIPEWVYSKSLRDLSKIFFYYDIAILALLEAIYQIFRAISKVPTFFKKDI
jgi:hypothetical protein